jgi:hypothetical protein
MFKWRMPGMHTNGIRLGDGWSLPAQERLGIDVPNAPRATGRTNESVYDPVTDAIYVVGHDYDSTRRNVSVQLRRFSCVPVNGTHRWSAINIDVPIATLGAPASFTFANVTWPHNNVAIAGRLIFYPFVCEYGVSAGSGNAGTARDRLRKTQIVIVNVDTQAVSSIALPSNMPWWTRTWDGPEKELGQDPLTVGEKRAMRGVGSRLVLGPDHWQKIGVDPWLMSYDPSTQVWTAYDAPTMHDWPNTLGSLAAVPSLNEAWLIGNGAIFGAGQPTLDWRTAQGMHVPAANSGRRIIRFRIS